MCIQMQTGGISIFATRKAPYLMTIYTLDGRKNKTAGLIE